MPEQKSCKQCQKHFTVENDDLEFYKKISPTFAGKTFEIPSPTLCPQCRSIRRLCWRNERNLYKRKSDKTDQEVIAIYSPDKPYKVFENSEWHKDDWDPMNYGQSYDSDKSFFEQFGELLKVVPRQATSTAMLENSDYCNQTWQAKGSYLCFNCGYIENCLFCSETFYSKDCVDCFSVKNSEYCYRCFDSDRCNKSVYLEHCNNCSESYFSYDCIGCNNIMLCTNLRNKQFCIENKQYPKEEYNQKIEEVNFGQRSTLAEYERKFRQKKLEAVHKENNNLKSENCSGDYLTECKNCHDCYTAYKSENCRRIINIDNDSKDCADIDYIAEAELCYEGTSVAGYKNLFCAFIPYGDNNLYCNFCEKCSDCFGCVGLKHKQYCILNKQYSKEDYEKLVGQIIEKMTADGEWGEFFPTKMSFYGYNETVAQNFYPKTKEEAEKAGINWLDKDYSPDYTGDFYQPKDNIEDYENSEDERSKLLGGIIKCEKTGKPYKIMPQELAFYLQNKIAIPIKHPDTRYLEIFHLKNPMRLYHRQCMCEESGHDHEGRCLIEFETTYAPERPEKVYCESCYQKSVL